MRRFPADVSSNQIVDALKLGCESKSSKIIELCLDCFQHMILGVCLIPCGSHDMSLFLGICCSQAIISVAVTGAHPPFPTPRAQTRIPHDCSIFRH